MKNIFIIICLIFFNQNVYGQNNNEIDSLIQLASLSKHDSTKLNVYLKICEICDVKDNLKYGHIAAVLAEKLARKAKSNIEKEKYIKKQIQGYKTISVYYGGLKNVDSLEAYALKSLNCAIQTQNQSIIHDAVGGLVENYLRTYKITKAINFLLDKLKEAESKNNKKETIFLSGQLSKVYSRIRNNGKALDYQLKVLKISEEIGEKEEMPWIYLTLGTKYANLKDYKSAIPYYLKSYNLLTVTKNTQGDLRPIFLIATAYNNLKNYTEARNYFLKALKITNEKHRGDSIVKGVINNEIGEIYFNEKNYSKALEYKLHGISLINSLSDGDAFKPYLTTGDVYLAMGKYQLAENYVLKAKKIAEDRVDLYNQREVYKTLSTIYKASGDKAKSNEFLVKYYEFKDSLNKVENAEELLFKEMNYENEKNELKLKAEQDVKDKSAKEEKEKQRLVTYAVSVGLLLIGIFALYVMYSLRKTRQANKVIIKQKSEVELQKHLVDEKQKEIIESITYAKRLQEAILPPQEFIDKHLQNNFILYKPKDLVAGDFYWAEKINDMFFIAAADSTGHGVPGAMVSVVCSNALNRTTKEFKLAETGKILDKTRELVLETFEKSTSEVKDGMDISLLCIDSKNKNVYWSGANNPLWYIQDNELKEIKADKQPIGKTEYPKPFTTHSIEYKENTTFYLFTDGFADQFGGPNGKKFKYKQFSELLFKNKDLLQQEQSIIIDQTFTEWKGDLEQVDDVCIIGIKI